MPQAPARQLARALAEGFVYQGDPSPYRKGEKRGTPSADLPPTAFVLFLQNHDQIGNRAVRRPADDARRSRGAEGRDHAAAPQPEHPADLHGRGADEPHARSSSSPTIHGDLADAVREGRRREFASFTRFGGEDIPDPNARETFERSRVAPTGDDSLYRRS